jgi:hypothetical protein
LLWTGSSVAAATKDLPTATPPAKLTTADAIFGVEKMATMMISLLAKKIKTAAIERLVD